VSYSSLRDAITELKQIFAVADVSGFVSNAGATSGYVADQPTLVAVANSAEQAILGSVGFGSAEEEKQPDSELENELRRLLLDLVDGGFTIEQMNRRIQEFLSGAGDAETAAISSFLQIDKFNSDVLDFYTGNAISDMMVRKSGDANAKAPTKTDTNLAFIQAKPVGLVPGTRMTEASSLYMNVVPAYEWSRAVPYLEITLISPQQAVDDGGRIGGITQTRFLLGRANAGPVRDFAEAGEFGGDRERQINESLAAIGREGIEVKTKTASGMELFTSPQTLVNANEGRATSDARFAPIIDKFRPFMTIKNFTIDIVSSGFGAIPYKNGKLNLVLHDRSRLGEIAELVRPDLYSSVELLIEYGWSHPDGDNPNNVFGRFINAARVKEKYGVKNSAFVFQSGGQVDIALELITKGVTDLSTSKVGETSEVQSAFNEMQQLTDAIGRIRGQRENSHRLKEIIPVQLLDSVSDLGDELKIPPKLKKQIQKLINTNYKNPPPAVTELQGTLKALLGPNGDGKGGVVNELNSSLAKAFEDKFVSTKNRVDPILENGLSPDRVNEVGPSQGFVSLGKLLLLFLGEPLVSTARFDEVQIVTYAFNDACGKMRNSNIGSLPIEITHFEKYFKQYLEARGKFNITVKEFLEYIINNYVDDFTSPAYGISDKSEYQNIWKEGQIQFDETGVKTVSVISAEDRESQQSEIDELKQQVEALKFARKTGLLSESTGLSTELISAGESKVRNQEQTFKNDLAKTKEVKLTEEELNAIKEKRHERLLAMGLPNGEFIKAEVSFFLEAVPKAPLSEGEILDEDFTLLRIHIFDEAASPYKALERMLNLIVDKNLDKIDLDKSSAEDVAKHRKKASEVLQAGARLGLITKVGSGYLVNPNVKPAAIKQFVASQVPNIRYGTQSTAVTSMGMKSKHDGDLGSVHMHQMFGGDPTVPPGVDGDIVPLRMLPTELQMESLGCPFFNYTQQYFIDLDTGTTVDNIYAVGGATYNIEAGKFTTSVKMVNLQSFGKFRSVIAQLQTALEDINLQTEGLDVIQPPAQKSDFSNRIAEATAGLTRIVGVGEIDVVNEFYSTEPTSVQRGGR